MSIQNSFSIHVWSKSVWTNLIESKNTENREGFNKIMLTALPELNKYMASRLKLAVHKNQIPEGKFEVADFVNDLFIEAYDQFSSFNSASEFSNWLYVKLDELISDQITEEEFDDFFFNDFANLSEAEWAALEQKKASENEPQLEVEQGLTKSNQQLLASVFKSIEEQQQLERMQKVVEPAALNKHLNLVRYYLPTKSQLAMHLIDIHQVHPKDVAFIHGKSEEAIEKEVKHSKKTIRESFAKRYDSIVF